jgi:hypothetical protein
MRIGQLHEIEVVVLAARRRRALRAAQTGREHDAAHARHLQKLSSIESLSHRLLLHKYGNACAMQYRRIAIDIPVMKDFVRRGNNAAARSVGRFASRSVSQRYVRSANQR